MALLVPAILKSILACLKFQYPIDCQWGPIGNRCLYYIYNGACGSGGMILCKMDTCPTSYPKEKGPLARNSPKQTHDKRKRKHMEKEAGITSAKNEYDGGT